VRRRRLERQLDALRDGLLDEREAREVEHLLESSSDAGHFLRRRVDAEVDAPSRLRRWLATVREAPRLAPSLATAGAALVLALAILVAPPPTGTESPSPEGGQDAPLSASESTVYDLVAESGSVMLYEADDVTILWVSDDEDEVSRHGTPRAGWA
jgi:hypothetical protein